MFTVYLTDEEINTTWQIAKNEAHKKSLMGDINLNFWEQEEILKVLNDILEGFTFYENF